MGDKRALFLIGGGVFLVNVIRIVITGEISWGSKREPDIIRRSDDPWNFWPLAAFFGALGLMCLAMGFGWIGH